MSTALKAAGAVSPPGNNLPDGSFLFGSGVLRPVCHLPRAIQYLVLLAPLALIAGLALRWTRPAPYPLAIDAGRDQFIERSRTAGTDLGVNLTNWTPSLRVEQKQGAVRRYSGSLADLELRPRLQPAVTIFITWQQPEEDGKFESRFAPTGDLLGWSLTGLNGPAPPQLPPDQASHAAQQAASHWLQSIAPVTLTDFKARSPDDNSNLQFQAGAQFATAPNRTYPLDVSLRGDRLVSASFDSVAPGGDTWIGDLEDVVKFCGATLTGFFLLYSLKLFRRRRREGEIPRGRALLLIAIFALCGGTFVGLNTPSLPHGKSLAYLLSLGTAVLSGLGNSLLFALGGLFVSAAYASGEGEIREGWPGKLIAFDALLAGRWFTSTVGVSALLASSVAAWAFFLSSCAWRIGSPQSAILVDKDLLTLALGRFVLLRSLVDLPLLVSFLIVAGLFMPLAFVHRRGWRNWKSAATLIVCPLLVQASFQSFSLSGIGPLFTTLGMVASVLVPFYLCDVLAAVLGAIAYSALTTAAAIATAVPALSSTAILLLIVVTAAIVPMAVAAWRGRAVDELTVRPTYARNLDERLSLQAEVSAAREAQLRLLPVALPQNPSLSVAAYCRPAGVVGGDFYDFFRASDDGLTVFVASGSGLGLASALTIALAKGFLASEIRRGENPASALQGLLHALSGRVGPAAGNTGLLLLSLDPARGVFHIARRGKFPALWLFRGPEPTAIPLTPANGSAIESGTLDWRPGDALFIHTEGFIDLLDDHSLHGQQRWLRTTAKRTQGYPAGWIEADLTRRLGGRKGKRLRKLRRDLTTVVLRNQAV